MNSRRQRMVLVLALSLGLLGTAAAEEPARSKGGGGAASPPSMRSGGDGAPETALPRELASAITWLF